MTDITAESLVTDYLRHLAETDRAALEAEPSLVRAAQALRRAGKAGDALMASDPRLCQGFIRIERVASGTPVHLYGQPGGSLAHNRISLRLGRDDAETNDRVPGDPLFSALLSEQSLSNLVMAGNRSAQQVWVTAETAMGQRLGPFEDHEPDPDQNFDLRLKETHEMDRDRLSAVALKIKAARLPLSKAQAQELSGSLDGIAKRRDDAWLIEHHHETMVKRRVAMQVEMVNTILNIAAVNRARETLRLAPPEPERPLDASEIRDLRQVNPVLNALFGRYDTDQEEIILRAAAWRMDRIMNDLGITGYDALSPDPQDTRLKAALNKASQDIDRGLRDKISAEAKKISVILNEVNNPYVLRARRETSPWMLTAGFSLISGSTSGMHSDHGRTNGQYVQMTISRGHATEEYGDRRVRATDDLFTIEMSQDEFMTALRGGIGDEWVRCSITRLAESRVEHVPYVNRYDVEIEKIAQRAAGPEENAFRKSMLAVRNAIQNGVTNAGQREEVLRDLSALSVLLDDFIGVRAQTGRADADRVRDMVSEDLSGIMNGMLALDREESGNTPELGN